MTPAQIVNAAISADVPVILWGPPGTGKTSWLRALAAESGADVETLIGSTLDAVDVCGMPVPHHGRVAMAPPAWAERIHEAIRGGRPAWLYLDELSCAPPSVQAALLRVVHERLVGDIDLTGCRVIAAANRADTAADGGLLSAAAANRWAHVDWSFDMSTWLAGEMSGWGRIRTPIHAAAAASVCAFLRRSPAALLAPPADIEAAGGAWPSPRSWSNAIAMMASCNKPLAACEAIAATCVGRGAAAEWSTYHASLSLPDPEDVLAGTAKIPARGDEAHAVMTAIVAAALADRPERNARILRAWKILGSVRPDVAITPAKALISGAPDIAPPEAIALGGRIMAVTHG